ncbi:hypothetical protein P8452_44657 [Trifolium repens]|nr:hypothetical protein P8452_44657 [Trifolium repens]
MKEGTNSTKLLTILKVVSCSKVTALRMKNALRNRNNRRINVVIKRKEESMRNRTPATIHRATIVMS